jgi:hypothetical protein
MRTVVRVRGVAALAEEACGTEEDAGEERENPGGVSMSARAQTWLEGWGLLDSETCLLCSTCGWLCWWLGYSWQLKQRRDGDSPREHLRDSCWL